MKNDFDERYNPVAHNEKFKQQLMTDKETQLAYQELEEKYFLIAELIKARKMAHKTQKEVAEAMHTSSSVVARLESGAIKNTHSPTIDTLQRYAKAVGCRLKIQLIPVSHL